MKLAGNGLEATFENKISAALRRRESKQCYGFKCLHRAAASCNVHPGMRAKEER